MIFIGTPVGTPIVVPIGVPIGVPIDLTQSSICLSQITLTKTSEGTTSWRARSTYHRTGARSYLHHQGAIGNESENAIVTEKGDFTMGMYRLHQRHGSSDRDSRLWSRLASKIHHQQTSTSTMNQTTYILRQSTNITWRSHSPQTWARHRASWIHPFHSTAEVISVS